MTELEVEAVITGEQARKNPNSVDNWRMPVSKGHCPNCGQEVGCYATSRTFLCYPHPVKFGWFRRFSAKDPLCPGSHRIRVEGPQVVIA